MWLKTLNKAEFVDYTLVSIYTYMSIKRLDDGYDKIHSCQGPGENHFASVWLLLCVCLFVCVNSNSNGHTVGKEGS